MTTPERRQEIDRILAAALERSTDERAHFLTEACAGDIELRREVESLLAKHLSKSLAGAPAIEDTTRQLFNFRIDGLENKSIGPYKIVRSLGIGGMGHVYLGHDLRLNRPVAVKLLSVYDAANKERLHRFRQEALAASALNHPNILTIYEINEFEDHNYLVAEFVEGQTLQTRIKQGPLSLDSTLEIAIQVASALSAAHAAGIIHRDIKPANIMLRPDGLVKVLDFGIAKYEQRDVEVPQDTMLQTKPGTVVGTVTYMSPEQARGLTVDSRTDLWSLGVILFEMLSAKRPFGGDTPLDVMAAIVQRDPPLLSQIGINVLEPCQRIVSKLLQKPVDSRYQTANELIDDLRDLKKSLEQIHATNIVAPPVASFSQPTADPSRAKAVSEAQIKPGVEQMRLQIASRRILTAIALLALLLVAGVAYWSYTRSSFEARSIAVLPFRNETGNSDLEYLSDGMTESLINSLAQIPQVTVKAPTSVFRYKNSEADPERIANELAVDAILSGRVVQRGDDLTLFLSFIDARTGNQVWGEQYNRKGSDLISLQREIALDVSKKLRVRLSGAAADRITKDYTANTDAYRLFLRGRFHIRKLTPPEVQKGIENFQRAIDLDSNYALAYVGLSEAFTSLALGSEMPPREYLGRSKAAAQKALQLDGELAEAHTAMGSVVFWLDRNWVDAENHYQRALEINPNIAEVHFLLAHLLSNTGRHEEAIAALTRAKEIDPLSPFIGSLEGQFLLHAGRTDEALERLRATSMMAPGFWFPHLFMSSAYIEKRMYAEAIAEARRASELSPFQTISFAYEGYALAKLGKRDEARALSSRSCSP